MSEAIPPLPQYAFMAWCSVKAWGKLYLFSLLPLYGEVATYRTKKCTFFRLFNDAVSPVYTLYNME
jgi:hypothetical protein